MYHLVIFWRDFFPIDFYCKSGQFVMQNRYTSFYVWIMQFPNIDKIPAKAATFLFDSNSSYSLVAADNKVHGFLHGKPI